MTALEGFRPSGWAASAAPVTRTSGSAASKTRLRRRRMWNSSRLTAPTDTGAPTELPSVVRVPARFRHRLVAEAARLTCCGRGLAHLPRDQPVRPSARLARTRLQRDRDVV